MDIYVYIKYNEGCSFNKLQLFSESKDIARGMVYNKLTI